MDLALIMAAGYGKRMGALDTPKVMLQDDNKLLIEDALSFLKYKSKNLDFAVMSRKEPKFQCLDDYLLEQGFGKNKILYQKSRPRDHITAFSIEFYLNPVNRNFFRNYENIIVLPADHKLISNDLNLNDLLQSHKAYSRDATLVYSTGWKSDTSSKDLIKTEGYRITDIRRINPISYLPIEACHQVTSVGVWVVSTKSLSNPLRVIIPTVSFALSKKEIHIPLSYFPFLKAYAYFISKEWAGGRDTLDKLK